MGKDKSLQINKNGDVVYHTADEFLKLALSFIPGGIIADSFLNFQGNLKRRRVIEFSESLKKALESFAGRELHANDFNDEDFVDIMESVYKKVQNTKSEYKLERFKNILLRQILDKPIDYQLTFKYVDVVDSLTDIEMLILGYITENSNIKYTLKDFCNRLAAHEREEHEIKIENNIIQVKIGEQELNMTPYTVEFYINELTSKGLIIRFEDFNSQSPDLVSKWGKDFRFYTQKIAKLSGTRIVYVLTGFGHKFIDFVKKEV